MEWEFIVLDWFQSIQNPVLTKILGFVTMLGEAGWFWILLGVLLFISKKYRPCGVALLAALLLDLVLANMILKPLVARPRPCWIRDTVRAVGASTWGLFRSLRDIPWLLLQQQELYILQSESGDIGQWSWLFLWEFPVCIFMYISLPMCWLDWFWGCSVDVLGALFMKKARNTKFGKLYKEGLEHGEEKCL